MEHAEKSVVQFPATTTGGSSADTSAPATPSVTEVVGTQRVLAVLNAEPVAESQPTESNEADALSANGIELARSGNVAGGVELFRQALRLCPGFVQARQNLGVALGQLGDVDGALDCFRLALLADRNYFDARLNLATTLAAEERNEQAIDAYREAIRLRPDSVEALNGLGLALTAIGHGAEAAIFLRQATRLKTDFEGAFNNLGLALADAGKYPESLQAFEQALRLNPRHAEAHTNLGNTYKEQGRLDEAIACYDLALSLKSTSASPRWNRSLALLQKGDFDQGWQEYESRSERPEGLARHRFDGRAWDGSALGGRSVLICCEQGLGDAIQFIRYAALLKRAGAGRIICWCPPPLIHVVRTCPDLDEVVPEGQKLPEFDLHVPVMSLPRLFGTVLHRIPATVPYLFPDPARVQHWRAKLNQIDGFKIGIAWQGNPHHKWDRHRSVPLVAFAPIAQVAGVRLVSLQCGPGSEQARGQSIVPVLDLLDPKAGQEEALRDIAAMMKCLDLVISVDTLTAHLAGAVAAPVWVALSTMVDWRWLLEREDTPWYPTMRLFRQRDRGDWRPVFQRMAETIRPMQAVSAPVPALPPEIVPDKARTERPKLSLCMIVRDSSRTLPACLESVRPWVDEMIVVDTGSVDDTPEIAEQFGARVFQFPWCDDFAAARNESLRHARGEWIFWMDSDDTIDQKNGQKLRDLPDQTAVPSLLGYVLQVHCPGSSQPDADVTVVDHVKVVRNRPDLRFEGRIHEQILPAIRRAVGDVGWTDIHVVHSGSDHSLAGKRKKLERDLRLLKLDIQDRPGHSFVLFNLGMTLADAGMHVEAAERLADSIRLGVPEESHLRKAYALHVASLSELGRQQEAMDSCRRGLELYADDPELNFRAGLTAHRLGKPEESVKFYQQAMRAPGTRKFSSIDRDITGYKAHFNLAAVHLDLKQPAEAERAYRQVVLLAPNWEPGRRALIDLLIDQGRRAEAEEELSAIAGNAAFAELVPVLEARLPRPIGLLAQSA